MEVRGARCLVTGASGGIGSAVAQALAGRGASVVALGRDAEALEALGAATVVVGDLAERSSLAEAAAAAGDVDVLVNCAGVGWAGPFPEISDADIERILAVDLLAPIVLTRSFLPAMLERGRGHVVNVASIVGHTGSKEEAVYAAAKAGLVAFTESLRQELAGRGVGFSLVTPGVIETRFFERRGKPYDRRFPEPIAPERVAQAVVRAIERDAAEVFVPRWMTVPARLRGAAPGLFRRLVRRFG